MSFPTVVLLSRCRNVFAAFGAAISELGGDFVGNVAAPALRDLVVKVRKFPLYLWQEARGRVIRKRYEGLKSRIDAADIPAKSACFGVIKSKFEPLRCSYASASRAERKRILKFTSETAHKWSDAGDWPHALGLAIIMFNLETGHLPGDDASVVKAATDALIKEANAYSEPQDSRGGH
jgi:hypothetical protein